MARLSVCSSRTRHLQMTAPFKLSDPYTTLRDDKLNYGIANVWVPENRRRGSMGSIWGEITQKNQKVKYRRSDPMLPSDFWPSLASKLKTSPEDRKSTRLNSSHLVIS